MSSALWVSGFVTITLAPPALPVGVVITSDPAVCTTTPVADTPPTLTVAPAWKPDPLRVTTVPPAVGPLVGVSPVSVGAGAPADR